MGLSQRGSPLMCTPRHGRLPGGEVRCGLSSGGYIVILRGSPKELSSPDEILRCARDDRSGAQDHIC